ncbi:hypothetical protein BDZ89DRAFT_1159874, partial [Hymenopellis radicata]
MWMCCASITHPSAFIMYKNPMGSATGSAALGFQDDIEATGLQFLSWGDIDDSRARPGSSFEGSSFSEALTGNKPKAGVSFDVIPDIMTSRGSVGEDEQLLTAGDFAGKRNLTESSDDISSVSTAFHPDAHLIPSAPPDIVLKTSDSVLFYVDRSVLDDVSNNAFGTLLTMARIILVEDDSNILNIILHALYDIPSAPYNPSFATLVCAVDRLPLYGLSPYALITSNNHLFRLLYSHAPYHPMEVYMLAAHHDIDELAVLVSGHLLSFKLDALTAEMAERMGGRYLKRLFFLHLDRMRRLKVILIVRPPAHGGTGCESDPQRAWALAVASVVDDAQPDLSPPLLVASMKRYAGEIICGLCRKNYEQTLSAAAARWSHVT